MLKTGTYAVSLLLLLETCYESVVLAQTKKTSKTSATTYKQSTPRWPNISSASVSQWPVKNATSTQSSSSTAKPVITSVTTLIKRSSLAQTTALTRVTTGNLAKTTANSTRTNATSARSSDFRTSSVQRGVLNVTKQDLQTTSNPALTVTEQLGQLNISMPEYVYTKELFLIQCRSSGAVLKQVEVVNEHSLTTLRCILDKWNPSVSAYYEFESALLTEQSQASCSASIGLVETWVAFYLTLSPTTTQQDSMYHCAFTSASDYQVSEKQLLLIYVAPVVFAVINDVRDGYNVSGYCYGLGKPPPSFSVTFSCSSCPLVSMETDSTTIRIPDSTDLGSSTKWFFLETPYLWDSSYVKCAAKNHPRHDRSATTRITIPQPYLTSAIPKHVETGKAFTMTCTAKHVYVTRVDIINEKGTAVLSCYVNGNSSSVAGYWGFQPPFLDVDRTMPSCLAAKGRPLTVKVMFLVVASLSSAQEGLYRCAIEYWNGTLLSTMADDLPGYPLEITVPAFGLKIYPNPAAFSLGTWCLLGCVAYAKPPTPLNVTVSSSTDLTYKTLSSSDTAQTFSQFAPLSATSVNLTFFMTQDWDGAVVSCSAGGVIISTPVAAINTIVTMVAGAAEGSTSDSTTLKPAVNLIFIAFACIKGCRAFDILLAYNGEN